EKTPAQSVLIGPVLDPKANSIIANDVLHFQSFEDIPDKLI
ncbi:MAG: hypothetical protein K1060chlam4_01221, partial [Candidatus Anoxychlamydiales bacterium]|nr:hypothetical protein [Candidatus Anoxychlamydiales bacterium]